MYTTFLVRKESLEGQRCIAFDWFLLGWDPVCFFFLLLYLRSIPLINNSDHHVSPHQSSSYPPLPVSRPVPPSPVPHIPKEPVWFSTSWALIGPISNYEAALGGFDSVFDIFDSTTRALQNTTSQSQKTPQTRLGQPACLTDITSRVFLLPCLHVSFLPTCEVGR